MSYNTLEEFLEQFPKTRFIQVLPRLILKDSLPSYMSFAVEVVEVDASDERQVYKPPGVKDGLALAGVKWEQIGTALGLKWIPDLCRRLDDGRDRSYCHFQAGAVLSNLTGMIPVICNYDFSVEIYREQEMLRLEKYPPRYSTWKISDVRPDLFKGEKKDRNATFRELPDKLQEKFLDIKVRENVLQKQQYLLRLCESGARSRVIRKITGLPHVFAPALLRERDFAVLKVILRVEPQNEAERADLNRRLLDRMYPAYGMPAPTEGQVLIGGAGDRKALNPAREISEEIEEIDIDSDPQGEASEAIPISQESEETASATAGPAARASSSPEDSPPDSESFIAEVGGFAIEMKELIGEEETRNVVGHLLSERGYKKLKEVKEADRLDILSDLKERLDHEIENYSPGGKIPARKANGESTHNGDANSVPPNGEPDAPPWAGKAYAPILDATARRISKMSEKDLREGIASLIEDHGYDTEADPLRLSVVMGTISGKSPRQGMEEGYLLLTEYGIKKRNER